MPRFRPLARRRAVTGLGAGDDHGGGAVAEQSGRDQIRDRKIVALERERAGLDRQQRGVLVGIGQSVISGSGEAESAADAADAENRRALDIGTQIHAVDQSRVQRGTCDARDRNDEKRVQVAARQPGMFERIVDRAFA